MQEALLFAMGTVKFGRKRIHEVKGIEKNMGVFQSFRSFPNGKDHLDFWDSKPNMIFQEFLGGSPVPSLGKNLSII